jgi:hypothetical protein
MIFESYVDLPANDAKGGFDHADVHAASDRLYVAHTCNDALDIIDCARQRSPRNGQHAVARTDAEGAQRQMNRVGARAYADRLCDIEIGGKFPLEGHDLGAEYVPAALEGPAEGIVDFCLVMSVRATSTQMAKATTSSGLGRSRGRVAACAGLIALLGACTGKIGDGKIFVTSVSHVVRIRTGETNETAI